MSSASAMTFPDDYLTDFKEDPNRPKAPLKIRFLNSLCELPFIDKVFRKRAETILDQADITKHIKKEGVYLDTGTGMGHIIEELVNRKNICGVCVDPEFRPLRKVTRRLKEKKGDAVFFNIGGENVPVRENVLDGAFIFFVLHHIPFEIQQDIIGEIKRVLKDDGRLFIMEDVPANLSDRKRIEKWDARHNFEDGDDEHYYRFNDDWISFLSENGFELIENVSFESKSSRKDEGIIPHRCYVLQRKN